MVAICLIIYFSNKLVKHFFTSGGSYEFSRNEKWILVNINADSYQVIHLIKTDNARTAFYELSLRNVKITFSDELTVTETERDFVYIKYMGNSKEKIAIRSIRTIPKEEYIEYAQEFGVINS